MVSSSGLGDGLYEENVYTLVPVHFSLKCIEYLTLLVFANVLESTLTVFFFGAFPKPAIPMAANTSMSSMLCGGQRERGGEEVDTGAAVAGACI